MDDEKLGEGKMNWMVTDAAADIASILIPAAVAACGLIVVAYRIVKAFLHWLDGISNHIETET